MLARPPPTVAAAPPARFARLGGSVITAAPNKRADAAGTALNSATYCRKSSAGDVFVTTTNDGSIGAGIVIFAATHGGIEVADRVRDATGDGSTVHGRVSAGAGTANHIGTACGTRLQPERPRVVDPQFQRLVVAGARKSVPGMVPALPVSDQPLPPPPVLATVSVLPLGVMVTFAPADSVTASARPLRLLTTWPEAIPAPVTEPADTPLAVVAVVAVVAAPAPDE